MKAKLLIKLRHKHAKRFRIMRTGDRWQVIKDGRFDWQYSSLEKAKEAVKYKINACITEYIREQRENNPKRLSVEYYPW